MNGIPEVLSDLEQKSDHLAIAIEVLRPYTNGAGAPAKARLPGPRAEKVTLMPGWKQRRRCPHCEQQTRRDPCEHCRRAFKDAPTE